MGRLFLDSVSNRDYPVVMGMLMFTACMGVLGCAVLEQLRTLGFQLAGWSRTRRQVDGVACYAGREALPAMLANTDILVCLLPLTPETRGILNSGHTRDAAFVTKIQNMNGK